MKIAALIPAYNPPGTFPEFVRNLTGNDFLHLVIVNDGSSEEHRRLFDEIKSIAKVTVLMHAVNMGKGAALKTGLNHIYCHFPECEGVVTLDADGQHLIEDVLKVGKSLGENPQNLILGSRTFKGDVPLRSYIGNTVTRKIFWMLTGKMLMDTQTGLRGIPRDFIPYLLKINANGYEFELEMILSCKYLPFKIKEVEIETVYMDNNRVSHFNPFFDSMRIYFVLLRFALSSFMSTMVDYLVFIIVYYSCGSIWISQVSARVSSMLLNYYLVKNMVFYSKQAHSKAFTKYVSLVIFSGVVSYFMIISLRNFAPVVPVVIAKVIAESIMFVFNFLVQRDFIFYDSKKELPE